MTTDPLDNDGPFSPAPVQEVGVDSGPATPIRTAAACDLNWRHPGDPGSHLTWDHLLDLAVRAYWIRRPRRQETAA